MKTSISYGKCDIVASSQTNQSLLGLYSYLNVILFARTYTNRAKYDLARLGYLDRLQTLVIPRERRFPSFFPRCGGGEIPEDRQ